MRALTALCGGALLSLPFAMTADAIAGPPVPKTVPYIKFDVLMNVDPAALAASGLPLQQFCPQITVEMSTLDSPQKMLPAETTPYYLDPSTTGGLQICDAQFAGAPTFWRIRISPELNLRRLPWAFTPAQAAQFSLDGLTRLSANEATSPYTGNVFREYDVSATVPTPGPKPTNNHRP